MSNSWARRALYLLIPLTFVLAACDSTPPGGIGVVRDGGSFDSHKNKVRSGDGGIQCPNVGNNWNGSGSSVRWYPNSQAQHTIKFDNEGHPDIGPRQIDSSDNIRLTITGTLILYTNFDCSTKGRASLLAFDRQFSGRQGDERPWVNWGVWQVTDLSPILDRSLRSLSQYSASQLVPRAKEIAKAQPDTGIDKTGKPIDISTISAQVAKTFLTTASATFGHQYFSKATLILNKPDLPRSVSVAIDGVQAAFANVAKASAQLDAAEKQVKVSEKKQESYDKCASCARQDEAIAFNQSLPSGVTSVAYGWPTGGAR